MSAPAKKVFIISLDGATFRVLRPLIDQGYLPNIAAVIQNGFAAELESVIPAVTAPAWTSFMTGKHPSKHGIFGFTRFDPKDYTWKINNAQHICSKTIWQILSEKSKRVIVLNLPYTYPPYPINGVIVCGWDSVSTQFTYPPELSKQILETMPGYDPNLWLCDVMPANSEEEHNQFVEKLIQGAMQSTQLALHFLDKEPWDVFMVHFQQSDWIQHKLWGEIEKACDDPSNKSPRVEKVRECYQQLDKCVATLLSKVADQNPIKIILSDHGFGCHRGIIYPNYYLRQWGYLHPTRDDKKESFKSLKDFFRKSRLKAGRNLYKSVAKMRHAFDARPTVEKYKQYDSWVDFANRTFSGRRPLVDWSKSQAATVETYQCAFLYINLKGIGPNGVVEPGIQYEKIVADLISRFSEIRHPDNGEKLLSRVVRGRDIYSKGSPNVWLPDVILVPADGYNFSNAAMDAAPEPTKEGIHRPMGVLIIAGDLLKQPPARFAPKLIDMAPTILHLLGLPVPADMDGRVLEEILSDPKGVSHEDADNDLAPREQVDYSAEDNQIIEHRLKSLGYLE